MSFVATAAPAKVVHLIIVSLFQRDFNPTVPFIHQISFVRTTSCDNVLQRKPNCVSVGLQRPCSWQLICLKRFLNSEREREEPRISLWRASEQYIMVGHAAPAGGHGETNISSTRNGKRSTSCAPINKAHTFVAIGAGPHSEVYNFPN